MAHNFSTVSANVDGTIPMAFRVQHDHEAETKHCFSGLEIDEIPAVMHNKRNQAFQHNPSPTAKRSCTTHHPLPCFGNNYAWNIFIGILAIKTPSPPQPH